MSKPRDGAVSVNLGEERVCRPENKTKLISVWDCSSVDCYDAFRFAVKYTLNQIHLKREKKIAEKEKYDVTGERHTSSNYNFIGNQIFKNH